MPSPQDALRPWLEGTGPNDLGEWGLYCPLHPDTIRSASINFQKGQWYCHACERGGSIKSLLEAIKELPPSVLNDRSGRTNGMGRMPTDAEPLPSQGTLSGWESCLHSNEKALTYLTDRGFKVETLLEYGIGYDPSKDYYTIPIFDADGNLVNVRKYDANPRDERRKIWSLGGRGAPVLYPVQVLLESDEIIVCEGEWDALITNQHGFRAVTRTGSADVWRQEWGPLFQGKQVYVCHDMDQKGQKANGLVAKALAGFARAINILKLPFAVTEKHGKDLNDFWLEYGDEELEDLVEIAEPFQFELPAEGPVDEVVDVNVLESFDPKNYGKRQRLKVMVVGKITPPFWLPENVHFSCDQNALKCSICCMNSSGHNGSYDMFIDPTDPIVLEMMGASNQTLSEILRKLSGAQKCPKLSIKPDTMRSVERLYVRPEVDTYRANFDAGDFQHTEIVSVGSHDVMSNFNIEALGTVYPHPQDQRNTFQAWNVVGKETSIDRFEMTDSLMEELSIFQAGGRPLAKLTDIARDLENNVTQIYGRTEMHVLMDLVFHSVLGFEFGGTLQRKGWLDALIIGDTRTGKSKAASDLIRHYGAGEMVSGETSSFAGIVGGLEQVGGREWVVKWGAIPINDRRLVVIDEVSGLAQEDISLMSSIRSDGIAELTKIRSEQAHARTRLLWMGNPRHAGLADLTYGVQAIAPLIGQPEDIARFDLAMSVKSGEVLPALMHQTNYGSEQKYPSWLCHELLMWAWSRKPHQINWSTGAQDMIMDLAQEMGRLFVENPPLVQAANVRFKIARVACAIAARTFSTEDGETLMVTRQHVLDAVAFMTKIYNMPGFGYGYVSKMAKQDVAKAEENLDLARRYLLEREGLAKVLLDTRGSFKRDDLVDLMSYDGTMASSVISELGKLGMIRKEAGFVKVTPTLHQILREILEEEV